MCAQQSRWASVPHFKYVFRIVAWRSLLNATTAVLETCVPWRETVPRVRDAFSAALIQKKTGILKTPDLADRRAAVWHRCNSVQRNDLLHCRRDWVPQQERAHATYPHRPSGDSATSAARRAKFLLSLSWSQAASFTHSRPRQEPHAGDIAADTHNDRLHAALKPSERPCRSHAWTVVISIFECREAFMRHRLFTILALVTRRRQRRPSGSASGPRRRKRVGGDYGPEYYSNLRSQRRRANDSRVIRCAPV